MSYRKISRLDSVQEVCRVNNISWPKWLPEYQIQLGADIQAVQKYGCAGARPVDDETSMMLMAWYGKDIFASVVRHDKYRQSDDAGPFYEFVKNFAPIRDWGQFCANMVNTAVELWASQFEVVEDDANTED